MKTPIGYGKNMFGELTEYFPEDFEPEELEELNSKGIVSRRDDYGDDHYIYTSKETFKIDLSAEYSRYIERQKFIIESAKQTIKTYEQKQLELDRF